VKGTRGSIVKMDRVSKSSAGTEDVVKDDSDRAADRSARSDAVRLDLKAVFSGKKTVSGSLSTSTGEGLNTSNSTSSISGFTHKGCSSFSPGGDETGSSDRLGGRNLLHLGVRGLSTDGSVVPKESPNDGKLSREPARVDRADVKQLSLVTEASSSKNSSGGLKSTSIGLRPNEDARLSSWLRSFSETCDRGTIESTVILWRMLPRLLGGGMLVTASSAATEGGTASGVRLSRRR
jgi:hypothetical protein